MSKTLIIWGFGDSVPRMYVVPTQLALPYFTVDGHYLDERDLDEDLNLRIEHLAYMLGVEPWYDGKVVPTFEDFVKASQSETIRASVDRETSAWWSNNAPLAKYRYSSVIDLDGIEAVVSTAWL